MTDEPVETRWPRPLVLDDVRTLRPLDYEVTDLLARVRGSRMLWNTEQQVWYTYTPETKNSTVALRWIKNGGGGELALNQVGRFARDLIDLVDDRIRVIVARQQTLRDTTPDGWEAQERRLEAERRSLNDVREQVDSHKRRLNLASIMKTEPLQHVSLNELDGNPHLLNFTNGTYDVRTGELREHRPDDKITHVVPYEFKTEHVEKPLSYTAPKFWGMVWRAVGAPGERTREEHEEMVTAIMRWLGYLLHGSNPEKRIAIWKGASNIGKTQIVEIVCKLLGTQLAWPTASNKLITVVNDRHDAVTSPLAGRRAVLINELHRRQHLDEHMILQLVNPEGGGVELRFMRKDSFATNITWKITATTNDLPQSELPPQVQSRLFLLQLSDVSIPTTQINRSLTQEIIEEEAEAILAGLVTEWRAWWLAMRDSQARDEESSTGLVVPAAAEVSLDSYRNDSKPLHQLFLDERCEFDPTYTFKVAPPVLWRHCQAYFDDQFGNVDKKKRPGRNEFLAYLDKLPGVRTEHKKRGDAAPQRLWFHGIRLLEPDPGSKEQFLCWQETINRLQSEGSV